MATRKPLVIGVSTVLAELASGDTIDPTSLTPGTTAQFLRGDGSWSNTLLGNFTLGATSTETRSLGIGTGRSGDGAAELNFVGDATNTGYALRLRREGGANGNSELRHLGTGSLYFNAVDSGAVMFRQNSVNRLGLLTSGEVYGALEADVYPNDNAGTVQWLKVATIVPSASGNATISFLFTDGGIGARRHGLDYVSASARGQTTVTALNQSLVDGMVQYITVSLIDSFNGPARIGLTIDSVDGSGNATQFGVWVRRDTYNHGHKFYPLDIAGGQWLARSWSAVTTEPSGIVYATALYTPIVTQPSAGVYNFTNAPTVNGVALTTNLGTVTSVGLSMPTAEFDVTTAVTTSGTLTATWKNQLANRFLAAPNGSTGQPSFRAIVAADIPTLNQNTTGSAATLTTARTINGTSFNGSANITTANWGTARNLTIGNTAKSVNGSADVAWSMAELGIVGKNLFINGKMDFWQRATTTGSGTGAAFAADRWKRDNGGTGAMALIRQSFGVQTAVPGNPTYYLNANVASSSGTASYQRFQQIVEDVASLSGLTVTLSFYAKGTAGTKVAIECEQMFGSGGSASVQTAVQTITLTASWALYTMTWTIPSVSGKTIGNNNGTAITFWVSAGTDYSARVPGLGLQTGNFDFALFQLETGSQATPFEQRQYALELILCQRYYEVCNGNRLAGVTYTGNGDTRGARIPFITQKRIAPALTQSGSLNVIAAGPSGDVVNVSLGTLTLVSSVQMAFISIISNYAAFTSCGNVMGWGDNGVNAYTVYADAEL